MRIEYDASLTGLAAGVSVYDPVTGQFALRAYAAVPVPFPSNSDPSFQNTCEFLAIPLGLLLAHHLHLRAFRYHLLGDSVSSLAWASKGRVSSERARRASVVFSLLTMHLQALLALTTHVPGVDNGVYDGLSRNMTPTLQVALPQHLGSLLTLCNPSLAISSPEDHLTLSASTFTILRDN